MGDRSVITLDTAYEVKYESYDDFGESFFKDVYDNISFMIREIIEKNIKIEEKVVNKRSDVQQICNVIALMGQRGSGKSSALFSYCNFLSNFYHIWNKEGIILEGDSSEDNNQKLLRLGRQKGIVFTVLNVIDATLLENDENIIEIILGRMLDKLEDREKEIRREDENTGRSENSQLKRKIGNIYSVMHNKPNGDNKQMYIDEPAVITLKNLSQSWNLRKEFQELVEEYIRFLRAYGKDREQKASDNYLVIPIDDIDMNVEKCREMLEMIRKYLMVHKVIILTTSNFEQLTTVCRNHYYKELQPSDVENQQLTFFEKEQVENLAKEYLEKVIPTGRKIYMPSLYYIEGFIETNMLVRGLDIEDIDTKAEINMRELVSILLRLYTGVVCLSGNYGNHLLYPISIRKLCNYVKEFRQLLPVQVDTKAYQYNLNWLYNDIMKRFLYQNVGGDEIHIVMDLAEIEAEKKCDYLARVTRDECKKNNALNQLEAEFDKIISEKSNNFTNCIYLLQLLERSGIYSKEAMTCFHLYFSIIMTRMCFEAQFGEREEQKRAKQYLEGNWLFNSEKEIWSKYEMPILRLPEDISHEVAAIKITDNINEEVISEIQDAICKYQLLRLFVIPVGNIKKEFSKHVIENEVKIGLAYGKWDFSVFNLVKNIFDFKDFFENIKNEIKKQLENQNVNSKMINEIMNNAFSLQKEFEQWYEKYNTNCVIPFYSSEWMVRTLNTILASVPEEKEVDKALSHIVKILGKEVKMLDYLALENHLNHEKVWNSFCTNKYSEVFKNCPAIQYLQAYIDKRNDRKANLCAAMLGHLTFIVSVGAKGESTGAESLSDEPG